MWPSVTVKRLSADRDPRHVAYRATVRLDDARSNVRVIVPASSRRADRAEAAIRLRIMREINEMPAGRDWIAYLKEIEPIELSSRDI